MRNLDSGGGEGMTRALVPWDVRLPRLFESFRREIDELFDQFFGPWEETREHWPAFSPRANVAETDTHYEVTVDLPGMKPEEFTVELKDNQLWITGERKREHEEKGKTYHRIERLYGQFRRVIPFPAPVNAEKVEAEYKDGVLRILVPKDEAAQPKRIPVKAG